MESTTGDMKLRDFVVTAEEGKFQSLSSFLTELDWEDLKLLKEDDLLEAAPGHKLLMKVFVRRYLLTWLKDPADPFAEPDEPPDWSPPGFQTFLSEGTKPELREDGVLQLRGFVTSQTFKDFARPPLEGIITFSKKQDIHVPLEEVKTLGLAYCDLFEDDLKGVVRLVKKMPNCKEVDLHGNRFCGAKADQHLLHLLRSENPDLDFVNIAGCPLASVDRKEFFSRLSEAELAKLIWIPPSYFKGRGWEHMFPDDVAGKKSIAAAEKAHTAYSALKRK